MAERQYTRLTRAHVRTGFTVAVTSRCSLWLGHDHLLFIDSNGYTETYKRFYFRDVQAFTITLTKRRLVWNCIWASLGSICFLIWCVVVLSSPPMSITGQITGGSLLLLFAVLFLVNSLLGPTCIGQIKTAVQAEDLPPLSRLRRARSVLARLRPLITAAQGQLAEPMASDKTEAAAEVTALPAVDPVDLHEAPSATPPPLS